MNADIPLGSKTEIAFQQRSGDAYLRNVLDAIAAFVGVLEVDGVLREANAPALTLAQLSPADVIGRRFDETYWVAWSDETQARVQDAIARAAVGETTRYRERLRSGPESFVTVDLQIAPIRDEKGEICNLVASALDVTQLAETQARQELLTGELNHRVKNILAVVGALVSQTARRVGSKEELARNLEGRIAAMAKAVALLSRSQWSGFGLAEALQEQVEMYGSERFRMKGADLPVAPKAALGFALVAYELVTNAAKYGALAAPEGHVAVEWTIENGRLIWRWTEHGGAPAQTPKESGFGLLLIRNIAEGDLGGELTLDYAPEGLRVVIVAPLGRVQGAQMSEAAARPRPGDISGKRVLVVEDSRIIALEIASTLEAAGVRVVGPASTVEEGLAHAENGIDAAILDLDLAGRSSGPIAERLKSRGIPILTVAAGTTGGAVTTPFLAKPFTDQELIAAISGLLRSAARTTQ
ncbi:MAG TPA: HWE histidine kinase domain-containing protein [Caulobacterales bacterium]|nr:HWE histidine kinase domain-containing protein [Caulobacterales bacterium]